MRRVPLVCLMLVVVAFDAPAQTPPDKPVTPLARDRFKNLQVFGDIPQGHLFGTMAFMAGSLGVKCEFCHVTGDFPNDEKPQKQRAREMIRMTAEINRQFFSGERHVTCQSCHRGKTKPATTPIPEQAFWNATPPPVLAAAPSVSTVLAKYKRATGNVGGMKTFAATVHTRWINGSGGPTESNTTIAFAPPDRLRLAETNGTTETITIVNGERGWILTPSEVREATSAERSDAFRRLSNVIVSIPDAADLIPAGNEMIAGKLAFGLETGSGADRQRLFFDSTTGLLVRKQRFIQTAFGEFPSMTDFEEFQTVAGLRIPKSIVLKSVASRAETTITARAPKTFDTSLFERPAVHK